MSLQAVWVVSPPFTQRIDKKICKLKESSLLDDGVGSRR